MSPKTRILGLQLNREVAANHLKTCLSLLSLIAHQIPAIRHVNINQPHFVSHLQSIQVRHLDIQTKLSGLIKDLAGAEDWVAELGDGLASMQGKIRVCNHSSQSSSQMLQGDGGIGGGRAGRAEMEREWELAATIYWPLIAESYAMAKPLLETVRDEMADGLDVLQGRPPTAKTIMAEYNKLPQPNLHQSSTSLQRSKSRPERSRRSNSVVSWFGGKRQPKSKATTVRFARDVKARWFRKDEAIVDRQSQQKQVAFKRDHVVPLTSERKRSAGDYKNRTTQVKSGRYGMGIRSSGHGGGGGWIPSTAYF